MWYGRRYPDGRTDGYQFLPDGKQHLCYNESDDKINWMYLRLTFDTASRQYVNCSRDSKFSAWRDWVLPCVNPIMESADYSIPCSGWKPIPIVGSSCLSIRWSSLATDRTYLTT